MSFNYGLTNCEQNWLDGFYCRYDGAKTKCCLNLLIYIIHGVPINMELNRLRNIHLYTFICKSDQTRNKKQHIPAIRGQFQKFGQPFLQFYLYILCLSVCLSVCPFEFNKRLNRLGPNFVWDFTWPQWRVLNERIKNKMLCRVNKGLNGLET